MILQKFWGCSTEFFEHLAVDIIKVGTIHIDTNLTSKGYYNDKPSHAMYEHTVNVNPGHAIN